MRADTMTRPLLGWKSCLLVAAAVTLRPSVVLAHETGGSLPWSGYGWWDAIREADPGSGIAILLLALTYTVGVWHVWRTAGVGRGVSVVQVIAYGVGILALAFALVSPLDTAADAVFTAHMIQHILLIAVVPPALVMGNPGTALLWALPRRARRSVAAALGRRARSVWHGVTTPWIVWIPHTVVLWLWHLPRLYVAALDHPIVHATEHVSFMGTAVLVWWAVLRPRGVRRDGYAVGILVLLVVALQSTALGALLTFARKPWYPVHGVGPGVWGLTPLQDQQTAGLVMWIPGGIPYLIASATLFLWWLGDGSATRRTAAITRWPDAPAAGGAA